MEVILQRMQPSEPTDTLMRNKQRSGHTSIPGEGYRKPCPVLVTLTSAWSQDEPCPGLRSRYARGQLSFFFFFFKTDVTVQRGQS